MKRTGKTPIPLCHSPLLQDLCIALGRRSLKSLRYNHTILRFESRIDDKSESRHERLDVEASKHRAEMTKIVIWEDGASWVYRRLASEKSRPVAEFEAHANLTGMDVQEMAELIRATLLDFDSVRQIWCDRAAT